MQKDHPSLLLASRIFSGHEKVISVDIATKGNIAMRTLQESERPTHKLKHAMLQISSTRIYMHHAESQTQSPQQPRISSKHLRRHTSITPTNLIYNLAPWPWPFPFLTSRKTTCPYSAHPSTPIPKITRCFAKCLV